MRSLIFESIDNIKKWELEETAKIDGLKKKS